MDLTERDKKLLKILAVLCAFALPYLLLIRPMNEKIATQEELNAEAQAQVDAYNEAQTTLETKNNELNKSSAELEKETPNTTAMINNYETHYVFMDLAQRNNLSLTSLTISDPIVAETEFEPVTAEDFATFDYVPIPVSMINLGELTTYNLNAPYTVEVTFDVEGNINDIYNMVDSINYYSEYFLVNSLSVSQAEEGETTQASIGVTVYFTGPKPVESE